MSPERRLFALKQPWRVRHKVEDNGFYRIVPGVGQMLLTGTPLEEAHIRLAAQELHDNAKPERRADEHADRTRPRIVLPACHGRLADFDSRADLLRTMRGALVGTSPRSQMPHTSLKPSAQATSICIPSV